MKSYEHELRVACELARAAGAAILEHYEGPLKIKQKNSADDAEPVTQADTIANDLIVSQLKREFPDDGILAEESVDTMRRLEKARVWMVDPLDGTNGFIDGNGDFAVQIGLAERGSSVRSLTLCAPTFLKPARYRKCASQRVVHTEARA
jgi:3'-phosphoadenosine 5'-phosphosulfate (PAPS) 3'-phosphatase